MRAGDSPARRTPGGLVVVDTNVVVAGLLTREPGAPTAAILDAMLGGELRFLLSEELLAEYRSVLLRPKIAEAHGLLPSEVDEILIRLASHGIVREPDGAPIGTAGDGHLVALLESVPASVLVSGDARLLRKVAPRGRTPREFAEADSTLGRMSSS